MNCWRRTIITRIKLNGSFIIINPNKFQDILNHGGRFKSLESTIQEAIKQKVSSLDWVYSDEGAKTQIQKTFNSFLHQDDRIKRDDIDECVKQHDLKNLILDHMSRTYKRLLHRYGKAELFAYENKVVRNELDKQWKNMLVESELIVEEVRGRSTQEMLMQYGLRLGKLFRRIYDDIVARSLYLIFVENVELEKMWVASQQPSKSSARVFGNALCPCGSNKIFAQCCGNVLHQKMPRIISMQE